MTAALGWASGVLPDRHVVACTQVTNTASTALLKRLGFHLALSGFHEFDAAQSLWSRRLPAQESP